MASEVVWPIRSGDAIATSAFDRINIGGVDIARTSYIHVRYI